MSHDQKHTRREYAHDALRRAELAADPVAQFKTWIEAALAAELTDATAVALATADAAGRPSNRIVLLKEFSSSGFTWFTDYRSQKGADLDVNPQAALLFYWREFERQVRISGAVQKLSREDSVSYFTSRPQDSRLAAAASHQSAPVANRRRLEQAVTDLAAEYPDGDVPVPEQWGGYRLVPARFEFWQGRQGRLHDRFVYTPEAGGWQIERLQP